MKTKLIGKETLQKSGSANLQRGIETVGGKLYLTNMRLIFEPHAINVQNKIEIIRLSDITNVSLGWTKFMSILPLFPNTLIVAVADQQFNFTVHSRGEWASTVSQQISRLANA